MAAYTYIPIQTYTLSSGATSVAFTSIPATYTDLRVVAQCQYNGSTNWYYQFNSIGAGLYAKQGYYHAGGGTVPAYNNTGQSQLYVNASNGNTTLPNMFILDILQYANPNVYKTILFKESMPRASVNQGVGCVRLDAVINRIDFTLYTSSANTSVFTLYGIKAE